MPRPFYLVISACFFAALNAPLQAQTSELLQGMASSVPVNGNVSEGTVLCSKLEQGNVPCQLEYDSNMIGVVTSRSAVSLTTEVEREGFVLLIGSGKAYVLVGGSEPVTSGDYLTSSTQSGVAQKARKSGYVLGVALENFTPTAEKPQALVLTSLGIKPVVLNKGATDNLIDLIREGVEGAFLSPLSALRYIVAAIVIISTIIFGFLHFGRVARSGVEAIGRNPLASRSIQAGMVMNVFLSLLVVGVGVIIAYLVLVI